MSNEPWTRFHLYLLGDGELDKQHQAMFNMVETVWKTYPPEIQPYLITDLRKTVIDHFLYEDLLMEKVKYPYAQTHKDIHKRFIEEVDELLKTPTAETLEKMSDMMLDHIDLYDRLVIEWTSKNGA